MQIFDITKELMTAQVYPGDPVPVLQKIYEMEKGEVCNLTAISMCLHNGTHIDAPSHFIQNGETIDEIDLHTCIGECCVASVFEKELTGQDMDETLPKGTKRLILKGYGKSNLTVSAAYVLVSEGVRLVGIDSQSVGVEGQQTEVHKILQRAGVIILEGLDLSGVQAGNYTLIAPPIKIKGVEGAPCRALLIKA
ncbi:MAG: hypothetical protein BGN88_02985 [Clostridiales bacterium 43-6]|nr:MAG: hypothetical protein BGN88_02985 [Clostridiales bacterium 43-6]